MNSRIPDREFCGPIDSWQKKQYLLVSPTSCCKYYEPFSQGKNDFSCIACKYSAGSGNLLICEHPGNAC